MPRAVPSCAAVLMIPEAVPRAATGTLVPSLVAATEDRPMPAPPAATHTGSAHVLLAAGMSAASQTAMIARPALTRRCGGHRASAGAATRGAGDDGEAERQQHQPGHQRAVPAGVLQVQRREGDGRASRQRVQQGTGRTLPQRPQTKHRPGQQRRRCAPVHDDEQTRQDNRRRQQRGTQRCPAGLRQQRRRDDERHHSAGEGADAGHAEPDRPVTSLIRRHGPPDGHGQQHSQRKVGPEHRPPADQIGHHAADNKPARARGSPRRAPGRDGPLPLRPVGGDRGQQPQCRRHRQRRSATLQAPRRRQHHRRRGGRTHDSGHGEERQAGQG